MNNEINELTHEKQLALAICIASTVHLNQLDRGGKPYILHPLKVTDQSKEIEELVMRQKNKAEIELLLASISSRLRHDDLDVNLALKKLKEIEL